MTLKQIQRVLRRYIWFHAAKDWVAVLTPWFAFEWFEGCRDILTNTFMWGYRFRWCRLPYHEGREIFQKMVERSTKVSCELRQMRPDITMSSWKRLAWEHNPSGKFAMTLGANEFLKEFRRCQAM